MKIYLTNYYKTATKREAEELIVVEKGYGLKQMALRPVEMEAEVIYNDGEFVIIQYSDKSYGYDRIGLAKELPVKNDIPKNIIDIIKTALGSDSHMPENSIIDFLLDSTVISEKETKLSPPCCGYQGLIVKEIKLQSSKGIVKTMKVKSEGYSYDISWK